MKKLEPYPIAISLFFVFSIYYVVCITIKYILLQYGITDVWYMHKVWLALLPGFTGINSLSFIIGLLEVSVGAYAVAYILVPAYNYLIQKKTKERKVEII